MRRNANLTAFFAALAILGSAGGVVYYQRLESRQEVIPDNSGFDMAQVTGAPKIISPIRSRPAPNSGLAMIKTGMPGMQFGGKATAQKAGRSPEADITEKVRRSENQIHTLAIAYTRRYPVIAEYGREWMSYPDLKKLNDDYMRSHDPIQFMRGLCQSKNFGILVRKYAREPAIHSFVIDAAKKVPGDLITAGLDYLNSNGTIKSLANNLSSAVGIPLSFFGSDGNKVNAQAVVDSALKNNPDLSRPTGE